MIKVLEKRVADKIAAGEVIERPVSIIKELIENSIDACASSIVCEIKNGGKTMIRVTDNGLGISASEVEKAFLRHATSKITEVVDLNSLDTLGFRGEALASIAAVTRTELITKTEDEKTGVDLVLHGGETVSKKSIGCPKGTTIIVKDLFYNTPARQKFMKSDSAESNQIISLLAQFALAYTNIKFRFINNENLIFSTTGNGNQLDVIGSSYKSVETSNLVHVEEKNNNYSVEGYISTPAMSKSTRHDQVFFVNGRVVNSKVLDKGLDLGYKERLFDGRFPVAFLLINVNPALVDVNIHPNKKEVKFSEESNVIDFISNAVVKSLGTKDAVVRVANAFTSKTIYNADQNTKQSQVVLKYDNNIVNSENNKYDEEVVNLKRLLSTKCEEGLVEYVRNQTDDIEQPKIELKKPIIIPFDFDTLIIIGSIFETYILAKDDNALYLFDQHAAHERILYEKFVNQYLNEEKSKQPILIPIIIDVDINNNDETNSNWLLNLRTLGYTIDYFGNNSYRITEIPTFMSLSEAENFAKDYIENSADKSITKNTVVIDKLIMKSCKAAIKANDVICKDEITGLIEQLKVCVNPFSCPHGRPTFIKLSNYEIERLFKRA